MKLRNKNKSGREILILSVLIVLLFAFLFSIIQLLKPKKEQYQFPVDTDSAYVIVIDPGHGGEDGGTSSKNGTLEKDLNLEISEKLLEKFTSNGYKAILTRSEDRLLYDTSADYKGRKKILDMQERLRITNESGNAIFISIHMNSFPESRYSGLQVYYSENNPISELIARNIQKTVSSKLQPDNQRQIKAGKNIFLLQRLNIPAILIECGFLSNEEDAENLSDNNYQNSLVSLIFESIIDEIT